MMMNNNVLNLYSFCLLTPGNYVIICSNVHRSGIIYSSSHPCQHLAQVFLPPAGMDGSSALHSNSQTPSSSIIIIITCRLYAWTRRYMAGWIALPDLQHATVKQKLK